MRLEIVATDGTRRELDARELRAVFKNDEHISVFSHKHDGGLTALEIESVPRPPPPLPAHVAEPTYGFPFA